MAYSYTEYTAASGNNTNTAYTTPNYLTDRGATDITVTVDGTIKGTATYNLSGTSITFTTGNLPAVGAKIKITRSSSQSSRLNDYSDASLLTADTLDADANQLFFIAQEALDTASETNLAAATFYSSGSTAPSSPSLGDLFFNTTSGITQVYSASGWVTINSTETRTVFTTPSSGERTFTTAATLGVNTFVFLNGVKLVEGSSNDYTLSGASVVLSADDPATSYVLEVINR
jgi:hypothetical protein